MSMIVIIDRVNVQTDTHYSIQKADMYKSSAYPH